ncbi:MAG: hypothetical protein ACRC46_10425 [Thermoguttaceae bacterium]
MTTSLHNADRVYTFVFEGFCGYPFGLLRRYNVPAAFPTAWRDLLFGLGSPAQAANFVLPLLAEFSHVETHYLPQTHHGHAVRRISSIFERDPNAAIVLIGYSYGGNAAHKVAHQVYERFQRNDIFPLVVTIDPVGKWRLDTTPEEVGAYNFTRSGGVTRWVNCYQRCDCGSFRVPRTRIGRKIWGDIVRDADENRFLTAGDFTASEIATGNFEAKRHEQFAYYAHLWVPAHRFIQETLRAELRRET